MYVCTLLQNYPDGVRHEIYDVRNVIVIETQIQATSMESSRLLRRDL
jgi:hypothetical protein